MKDYNDVKPGMRIITNEKLGSTAGMMIKKEYLDARKTSQTGIIKSYVGGHGGDVWWVEHTPSPAQAPDIKEIAAYCFDEFEADFDVADCIFMT